MFAFILVGYSSSEYRSRTALWDLYSFILLNLFLLMLAAIQAPVIMMRQHRLDAKDRLRSELDFEANRRCEEW